MEKGMNGDLINLLKATRKNPEKYQDIKNCKNLDEVYYFIKKIHPEYTFSKEELENLLLTFAKTLNQTVSPIPEKKLDISGGRVDENIKEMTERWKSAGNKFNKWSYTTDLMSTLLFSGQEPDLEKISKLMIDMSSGASKNRSFDKIGHRIYRNNARQI